MSKSDTRCVHLENNLGKPKTIFVSKHKWLHHKLKYDIQETSNLNRKTGKHGKGKQFEAPKRTLSGRVLENSSKNWLVSQRIDVKKGTGNIGHHRKETFDERRRRQMKYYDHEKWSDGDRGREDVQARGERLAEKAKKLFKKLVGGN